MNITLLILIILVPILAVILLGLNILLSPHKSNEDKLSQFECGSPVISGQARESFKIQYIVVAMLFLIFDIELLVLFPVAVCLHEISSYGFYTALSFFIILVIGFIFEFGSNAISLKQYPKEIDNNNDNNNNNNNDNNNDNNNKKDLFNSEDRSHPTVAEREASKLPHSAYLEPDSMLKSTASAGATLRRPDSHPAEEWLGGASSLEREKSMRKLNLLINKLSSAYLNLKIKITQSDRGARGFRAAQLAFNNLIKWGRKQLIFIIPSKLQFAKTLMKDLILEFICFVQSIKSKFDIRMNHLYKQFDVSRTFEELNNLTTLSWADYLFAYFILMLILIIISSIIIIIYLKFSFVLVYIYLQKLFAASCHLIIDHWPNWLVINWQFSDSFYEANRLLLPIVYKCIMIPIIVIGFILLWSVKIPLLIIWGLTRSLLKLSIYLADHSFTSGLYVEIAWFIIICNVFLITAEIFMWIKLQDFKYNGRGAEQSKNYLLPTAYFLRMQEHKKLILFNLSVMFLINCIQILFAFILVFSH